MSDWTALNTPYALSEVHRHVADRVKLRMGYAANVDGLRPDLTVIFDALARKLVGELELTVAGHYEETRCIRWHCRWPKTWWDHWKQDHPRLRKWLRLRPIEFADKAFSEDVRLYSRMCPHVPPARDADHFEWLTTGSVAFDVYANEPRATERAGRR